MKDLTDNINKKAEYVPLTLLELPTLTLACGRKNGASCKCQSIKSSILNHYALLGIKCINSDTSDDERCYQGTRFCKNL
jgi:hypothetical protein